MKTKNRNRQPEEGEEEGETGERKESYGPATVLPPFVNQDSQTVESTPNDEVERRSMPHTPEEHGIHVVNVGA